MNGSLTSVFVFTFFAKGGKLLKLLNYQKSKERIIVTFKLSKAALQAL